MTSSSDAAERASLAEAFDLDGYVTLPALLSSDECDRVAAEVERSEFAGAGTRDVLSNVWCRDLAVEVRRRCVTLGIVPADYAAIQCTLFRKSLEKNWFVARHQDVTIPVAERVDHPELAGWSDKEGGIYIQPPVELLERLVAVRLHLDDCDDSNGPLRVVPGSHRLGRLTPEQLDAVRSKDEVVCPVSRGGALVMRPLILHASSKSTGSGERRVLHFLFGPPELPYGLRWPLGV